jgi:hypothetical protein
MAANSSTFSLAGLAQGTVNTVLNAAGQSSVNFQSNPYVQFFLGNSFSSVLYGSGTDTALTGASNAPGFIQAGMGTITTYGRNTPTITSLNIARSGGLPQALSATRVLRHCRSPQCVFEVRFSWPAEPPAAPASHRERHALCPLSFSRPQLVLAQDSYQSRIAHLQNHR